MNKQIQIILAAAFSVCVIVNSILIFWEAVRRPAEDYLIINQQYYNAKEVCLKGGGDWIEADGRDFCIFEKE